MDIYIIYYVRIYVNIQLNDGLRAVRIIALHPSIFFFNTTGSAYEAIPGGAAGDGGSGQARKGGGILDREGYDQL